MIRRIVGTVVFIFVLVWILQSPGHAGASVHGWITGAITFMHRLT
jgi:hypothetical protein